MPSTSEPTLYEVLGVSPDAEVAEIKSAFRKRARKIHPDVAGDEMKSFFLLLQHAQAVLSDPTRRGEYDLSLRGGASSPPHPASDEQRTGARPADPYRVVGEQVPADVYGGPLPREGHDFDRMPWLRTFECVERSSVTITRAGLRRWQIAVIGAVSFLGALVIATAIPVVYLFAPVVLVAGALIWWTRRVPVRSLVVLGLLTVPLAGAAVLTAYIQQTAWQWAALGVLGALVAVCAAIWAVYDLLVVEPQRVRWRDIPTAFSWGIPGENLASTPSGFSLDATIDGIEGERLTAAEVGYFLGAIPGVRLVNSLAFPGTIGNADVDHAVMCGRRVAFIDSKAWKPAEFALVRGQDAIRVSRGGSWDYFPTHMPTAVQRYRDMLASCRLRDVEVRGFIVVHPKSLLKPMRLMDDSSDDLVQLVTAQDLIVQLGSWFSDDEDQARSVDRRLLTFLLRGGS